MNILKETLDLNDLRLFFWVVDSGGFSAASKALAIPTSTISQRIASLERATGTALLRRTTRSLSLTEAGHRLLPHARAVAAQAREARQALSSLNGDVAGTVRVSSSIAIAQFALAPILPKFLRDHPQVRVSVDATNRYVDVVGESYDVGLRAHSSSLRDSSLLQRVIARTPWTLAASPEYLQKAQCPIVPADLTSASAIYFGSATSEPVWELRKDETWVKAPLKPCVVSNDMATLRSAAIGGAGIVGLPTYIMDSALKQGLLVCVLQDWRLAGSEISIITPPKGQSSHVVKCFTDFVAAELPIMTNTFAGPGKTAPLLPSS